MRDKIGDFEKLGAQVIAVDPHESHRVRHMLRSVGVKDDQLAFPILADLANVVSATYGVAFQMNIHTEWSNRPATFVVDQHGVVRFERRGKSFGDRPKTEELLEVIRKMAAAK